MSNGEKTPWPKIKTNQGTKKCKTWQWSGLTKKIVGQR